MQFFHHSRKYALNEAFFDTWSPTMAYVLGFWFADGYMRIERSYRVVFFSKDFGILQQIRKAMSSNHPIRKNKKDDVYALSLCSKRLYKDLAALGGFRCKSKLIQFPTTPRRYLFDFIRGYFDGDGSVFYVRYAATKNQKIYRELRSNFTSGSRSFLAKLMRILRRELGFEKKVLGVFNDGSSLKLGYGTKNTKKLLASMYYPGFPIGLYRKAKFVYTYAS